MLVEEADDNRGNLKRGPQARREGRASYKDERVAIITSELLPGETTEEFWSYLRALQRLDSNAKISIMYLRTGKKEYVPLRHVTLNDGEGHGSLADVHRLRRAGLAILEHHAPSNEF